MIPTWPVKYLDLRDQPIEVRRRAAIAIARFACGGDDGRVVGDPVFEVVTEGRQTRQDALMLTHPGTKPYSACTDLHSYVRNRLGCNVEKYINREDEDGGVQDWAIGGGPAFVQRSPGFMTARQALARGGHFLAGDSVTLGDPWHVAILESLDLDLGSAVLLEYGGFNRKLGKAEGRRNIHPARMVGADLTIKGRLVTGIAPLEALPLDGVGIVPEDFDP